MVVTLGELVMILDLHRPGLSVSAIARRAGLDRKTVRRYVERGLEPPTYGPRPPRESKVTRFERYLRGRVGTFPELTAIRLLREIRELGYAGGYTAVKDFGTRDPPQPGRRLRGPLRDHAGPSGAPSKCGSHSWGPGGPA